MIVQGQGSLDVFLFEAVWKEQLRKVTIKKEKTDGEVCVSRRHSWSWGIDATLDA